MSPPLAHLPWREVPRHPFATYRAGAVRGQWWIECHCSRCNDSFLKQCTQPARTNLWVLHFSRLHGHGFQPRIAP